MTVFSIIEDLVFIDCNQIAEFLRVNKCGFVLNAKTKKLKVVWYNISSSTLETYYYDIIEKAPNHLMLKNTEVLLAKRIKLDIIKL